MVRLKRKLWRLVKERIPGGGLGQGKVSSIHPSIFAFFPLAKRCSLHMQYWHYYPSLDLQ